jgi:uncharacterized protein YndB with AHSA1/START domain
MTDRTTRTVSVSRTIEVPARTLFDLLAHTDNHPRIDGSGMVREALPATVITGAGQAFVMGMFNDEMGSYEMRNHVLEYEEGCRIVWEPVMSAASRAEDLPHVGHSARHRWGFILEPAGPDRTVVVETFDCRRSPAWLQDAVKGGERWLDAMASTLEKLAALASDRRSEPVPQAFRAAS